MSQFQILGKIHTSLRRSDEHFSWEQYILQQQELLKTSKFPELVRRRLELAQRAIKVMGRSPILCLLMSATFSQPQGGDLRGFLLDVTAAQIANIILHGAWPHSVAMEIIQAARDYELFYSTRLAGDTDSSVGIHREVAAYVKAWLLTMHSA